MIKFAKEEGMVLMADEVYQENIYQDERPFVSCRKVLKEMPAPYSDTELISYHSISKGVGGECGLRGGYFEAVNVHQDTIAELYKIVSVNLCPNTVGQVRTQHERASIRQGWVMSGVHVIACEST